MSDKSKIEWTDATWNPVRGCTKISPGCLHCYAETFAERFRGVPGHPFEFGFDLRLVPEKLGDPLRWQTSRKIFVNSMSDLFHEKVPDEYIVKVARVMKAANWHKPVDPIAIYDTLDRASDKGELRRVQSEVLTAWHTQFRNERDVILKLHTGQGKTLIGLLMLQSKLNEGANSAIYLCPNNYLIDQTRLQAKQFG
jgi:Protein of unknown function (DUF5131)/Type III restriction enzyme, res subunit